jgi:hypothetical protein
MRLSVVCVRGVLHGAGLQVDLPTVSLPPVQVVVMGAGAVTNPYHTATGADTGAAKGGH